MFSINQGTNEDDSQSNPHLEADLLISGQEDHHDMAAGVQRECTQAHDAFRYNLGLISLVYNIRFIT